MEQLPRRAVDHVAGKVERRVVAGIVPETQGAQLIDITAGVHVEDSVVVVGVVALRRKRAPRHVQRSRG